MSGRRALFAAASLAALSLPLTVQAQDSTGCQCVPRGVHTPNEFAQRSSGSFGIAQGRPQGAFAQNIHFGYGASGTYLFRVDHSGYFSLRADAGILQYGRETKRVPLSPTIGGRVQVDVSTDNDLVPVTIGPQLSWPRGRVRPYVNAGVGGQFFWTQSRVEGSSDASDFASTTNQHDATAVWTAGGGVLFPVYERRTKVAIDVGAQYFGGGHAQYLKPGSIQDLPDSQIRVSPLESDTRMLLVRLGVRIGI